MRIEIGEGVSPSSTSDPLARLHEVVEAQVCSESRHFGGVRVDGGERGEAGSPGSPLDREALGENETPGDEKGDPSLILRHGLLPLADDSAFGNLADAGVARLVQEYGHGRCQKPAPVLR